MDPNSQADEAQTDATRRFHDDAPAKAELSTTQKLAEVNIDEFDAVFFPGGHGPLWDLAEDGHCRALIEKAEQAGKVVSAVCHAPAVFRHTRSASGEPLVKGRKVTGFSNSEEEAVGLDKVVPFLLEDMLKERGAEYSRGEDWAPHVVVDGRLITGQNPASSAATAEAVVKALG